jgi:hypothetical protein
MVIKTLSRAIGKYSQEPFSMLIEIFKRNKILICLTYVALAIEETFISLIPFFLGLAIDTLLGDDFYHFWIYISIVVFCVGLSVLRRLWDTRLYAKIWSGLASDRIKTLINKGVERSRILSRTHMLIEYTRFYEYALPNGISAFIDILISCVMLFYFMPKVSLVVLVLLGLAFYVQYYIAIAQQQIEDNRQKVKEILNETIMHSEHPDVSIHLVSQSKQMIKFSDWDAYGYGVHEFIANIAEVIVIFTLVYGAFSTGAIMTNLTYVYKIFSRVGALGSSLLHFKILENYNSYLK